MATFLHVGSSAKRKDQTTPGFNRPEWSEIRLDIDAAARPDIVADMTDMAPVASGSMDAIYSSHNIEHLYIHQVPVALREFRRVLKPDGVAVIACPDLQAMAKLILEDKLHEPAYHSAAGPITPHDTLYGYGVQMAQGNLFMAHRCGFTRSSLTAALLEAGFAIVGARQTRFELRAIAAASVISEEAMRRLLDDHFPRPAATRVAS